MQDTDFTNIWDSSVPDRRPANGVAVDQAAEAVKTPLMSVPKTETDIVKLAARSVRHPRKKEKCTERENVCVPACVCACVCVCVCVRFRQEREQCVC